MPWLGAFILLAGILVVGLICAFGVDDSPRELVLPCPSQTCPDCPGCPDCPPPLRVDRGLVRILLSQHPYFAHKVKPIDEIVAAYNATINAENRVTDVTDAVVAEDATTLAHIPLIIYINMANSTTRNAEMQAEIRRWGVRARVFRFDGIGHRNRALGCFLSHVHCVAWAARQSANVLILEDDFVLDVPRAELAAYLASADACLWGRWDVIQLAQYVHEWQPVSSSDAPYPVFRLLHSTTASGYLVNRHYAREFLRKWSYELEARLHMDKFETEDWNDQTQIKFQKEDAWIGFDRSLGSQRAGTSEIGGVYAHNAWRCNATFDRWFDAYGGDHPLVLRPPADRVFRIAVVVRGDYEAKVSELRRLAAFKHQLVRFHVGGRSGVDSIDTVFHDSSPNTLAGYDKIFFVDEDENVTSGLLRGGDADLLNKMLF